MSVGQEEAVVLMTATAVEGQLKRQGWYEPPESQPGLLPGMALPCQSLPGRAGGTMKKATARLIVLLSPFINQTFL